MGDVIGIAAALVVVLLGLAIIVAMALRRQRAIEASGYQKVEGVDDPLADLTRAIFEGDPKEVHRKKDATGESWLVFVDTGSSEDPGCVMLVYPIGHDDWPALVLVHSGRPIPKIFRHLTGGIFEWAEPIEDIEEERLAATGWYAYTEPKQHIPTMLRDRLTRAARLPQSQGLLGIAVRGSFLMVWSEAGEIKGLLAAAPFIRGAVVEGTSQP